MASDRGARAGWAPTNPSTAEVDRVGQVSPGLSSCRLALQLVALHQITAAMSRTRLTTTHGVLLMAWANAEPENAPQYCHPVRLRSV